MPFGLKNADIEETFGMLRTYGVKINSQKCPFGVKSGRFLGYIVTERGIEANPSKVKALQDMSPPRNLKEAQHLTGRITALSRFILKTVDRSLPFFKILHRATKFQWDAECDKAFEELKDAEFHYTGLEKLAFTLVLVARRLRPYFLAHPIVVMINSPLGRVLLNPEASNRLIKCITELSEFDIRYQPRTAIKAQSLADFITEVQDPEPEATWKVYVDGSFTRQGSGIDVLLISPHGERIHLSVRLDYRATNNEAEYEALIAGLQAARHVGASKVLIHSDSQLAAQQLSGAFEISNVGLKLYAGAFEKLKVSFQAVLVQKIPRADNQAADELAKLAILISPIVIQQPIEQVSLVSHIDRMEGLTFPNDWRATIAEFLRSRATPSNREEAHLLRRRASRFVLIGDQLYKKAFSRPLLKCVGPEDVDYILQEARLDHDGGSWVDELPGVLWALRTMPKEGMGMTPFRLDYWGEVIVPVEVGIESDRTQHYDEDNAERRHLELDLVDEMLARSSFG
ncbi:uncharacterized protein LOC121990029 [Zingiber officinale]|uniref:uncharacterized protein LOC121990029 n=1 Tax=Zingiber officinale TaxID=94328 RepID=UPI001C4D40B8|nr:uncharacterized protein LOC121990029 [Zingiber officinale]